MPVTPFPISPSRADPNTFADRGDAYLGHLENPFVAEINALEANVNAKEASTNALSLAAVNAVNISAWVSGATYAIGVTVYDPADLLSYRRKTAGAGTTRPGLDNANWVVLNGLGNVRLDTNQTFSGVNTFDQAINGSGANLTNLNASNLSSGTVNTARLGSGTANNTAFLRGDNVWVDIVSTDVQTFNASGTWTKPSFGRFARIQVWGGGGGGGTSGSARGGGGGGGYNEITIQTTQLAQSITVTVGAGASAGATGGTSSFGSIISAFGGGNGVSVDGNSGGGGGGQLSPGLSSGHGGMSDGGNASSRGFWGGGGGGSGDSGRDSGGSSVFGGGGGGGSVLGGAGIGGSSVYGGNGGNQGFAGVAPGGGGGSGAAGAAGRVIVTVY